VQRQVRGHFEKDVADEEHAGCEAELGRAEGEVIVHAVRCGEPDRGAIEVVDEEHQGDEGDESPGDFPDRAAGDVRLWRGLVPR
jgi:hypothetical protein